jgi:hypothetical protein
VAFCLNHSAEAGAPEGRLFEWGERVLELPSIPFFPSNGRIAGQASKVAPADSGSVAARRPCARSNGGRGLRADCFGSVGLRSWAYDRCRLWNGQRVEVRPDRRNSMRKQER